MSNLTGIEKFPVKNAGIKEEQRNDSISNRT